MHLLHIIQHVDVVIYECLNGFAGNPLIDYLASFEENSHILKGGLFFAAFWYFWHAKDAANAKRREIIVITLASALLSLTVSRLLADLAPFRVRPMFDSMLTHRAYAFAISRNMENWSGFPSDTATFFFSLTCGLAHLRRRLCLPAVLYTAVFICLPRLYLGLHYASDILVGGVIGMVVPCVLLNSKSSNIAAPVIGWADRRPLIFYPAAFLVSFQMCILFDDVRLAARTAYYITKNSGAHSLMVLGCMILGITGLGGAAFWYRRLRERSNSVSAP